MPVRHRIRTSNLVQQQNGSNQKDPKKMIRNICSTKYNAHTQKLFGENRILKVEDLFKISTIRMIKKSHLQKTHSSITELYKKKQPKQHTKTSKQHIHKYQWKNTT